MIKYVVCLIFLFVLYLSVRKDKVYFIPFDIPGGQMAATVPPFGTFIEKKYKKDKSILRHEMAHWKQYHRMGFYSFYGTYFKEYIKYGRKNGPMEVEARKMSKIK
jgi:hypothetical protein